MDTKELLSRLSKAVDELLEIEPEELDQALILLACCHGPRSEAELVRICNWAGDLMLMLGCLGNVLEGKMNIAFPEDSDGPTFDITDLGKRHVESLG